MKKFLNEYASDLLIAIGTILFSSGAAIVLHWSLILTLPEMVKQVNPDKIGVLWIDGDHTYSGAKLDIEIWWQFLVPRGPIIIHDMNEETNEYHERIFPELLRLKKQLLISPVVTDWKQVDSILWGRKIK